jgi:hypothetical protein
MAHFAKVENGIVTSVLVVDDEHEGYGEKFLNGIGLKGRWIKTSYNTFGNQHAFGGTPLRKNYAGIGYTYDETLDAFIAPQPYASWTLNVESGLWEPPIPMPSDGAAYVWDEKSLSWASAIPGLPDYELE